MANGMFDKRFGPTLPGDPFRQWMEERLKTIKADDTRQSNSNIGGTESVKILSRELGISVKGIYRYRHGGENGRPHHYRLYRIEEMLARVGVPIEDIYPDLASEDAPLEPDTHCPSCDEVVLPIRGACPWCDQALRVTA